MLTDTTINATEAEAAAEDAADSLSPLGLSPMQWSVLTLVAQGMCNKEMAGHLGLSPRTVEIHRARALDKIVGARNGHHAIALAIDNGWISLGDVIPKREPRSKAKPEWWENGGEAPVLVPRKGYSL